MLNDDQLRDKLFEFMFELLISHGGDGDTVYKGSNWRLNANFFENWLINNHPFALKRSNSDGHISFYDDQECIYFTDTHNENFNECYYDIIQTERI